MSTSNLEIFMTIVERSSMAATAQDFCMSRSGVTMALRRLERTYRAKLVQRDKGRLQPTLAGAALYAYAREMKEAESRLEAKLELARERSSSWVRVGATRTVAPHFLFPILPRFKIHHPDIRVTVETAPFAIVGQWVLDGKVDFAYTTGQRHPDLVNEQVRRERICFVVGPDDPLALRGPVSPEDMRQQPFVVLDQTPAVRARIEHLLGCTDELSLTITAEVARVEALKEAVQYGLGCGWLYASLVENELRDGRLRELTVIGVAPTSDFYLVRRHQPPLTPAAAALYDVIRAEEANQDTLTSEPQFR